VPYWGMSSPVPSATITPETTIGELVAARPLLARLFETLGIDYCCGGKQTLAAACARRGLDVPTTITLLDSAGAALAAAPVEVDAAGMGLAELADHIEATHHAYLKAELPRLVEMAGRVAAKHAWRDGRLAEVATALNTLAAEMLDHMRKEEIILFPLVRQIEAGAADGFPCGSIANPIRQMEAEHESAGRLTARLRLLTDGYTPGPDACNTHRALLGGLEEFEADLHRHVHKENNVLFPRTLARASGGG
jgi:regulator of cell morphogenesis and NO signaling